MGPGKGVIDNKHSTDIDSTNRARASMRAVILKTSHAGTSDHGSSQSVKRPCPPANGCPWEARTCSIAAAGGHLEVLQWAHVEEGCPWDSSTCKYAARAGHMEILRWANGNGCPLSEQTHGCVGGVGGICWHAAKGGHLEMLKWAREHDCLWDPTVTCVAAECGNLEVLKWARGHGCEWDEMTTTFAAQGGYLEMLRWAREHDCPW